jgi:signal transduction histidine kinase
MGRVDRIDLVDKEAEAVAEIHEGDVDGRARAGVEHQPGGICLAADPEGMHLEAGPFRGDRGADLQHVGAEYQLTRGVELVWSGGTEIMEGCVDSLGFERVLSNLISNGIKFTPKGGRVYVDMKRNLTGLAISVRDFGAGMEPSDARRLFNRYRRLASHAQVSGTGLGLFIVKCIVSAHGGSIDVTSALGKGTTFDVYFPDRPPLNDRGEVLCLDFA